tara:strand:+ start:235 stop:570 length:336 start_codon:yes stop_codon:yes gene_type:complete
MAITYKWEIPQMDAHIEAEGQQNVIYTVHYIYTGSNESEGVTYSDSIVSTENFEYTQGDPFIPYENTEAFENIVIGWLEAALDVQVMQDSIAAGIEAKTNPVNEKLYFTWQ